MGTLINKFKINGVIDTNQNVTNNMNTLATACGSWLTYDVNTGLWSVIINQPGISVRHFDDNNIIGGINISGTGINELYNKVSIEFPHKDLRDQTDYIDLSIPLADRYPNELDNTLNIKLECINDPIQAQIIATQELKQSRIDKIIEFKTDYSAIGLRAGQLIDITNSVYGYTQKMFRIIKIVEEDADDGNIILSITALEYDANIYNLDGLIREVRSKKTGIVPKAQNTAISANDGIKTGDDLSAAILLPAALEMLKKLMDGMFSNDEAVGKTMVPKGFMISATNGQVTYDSLPVELEIPIIHTVTFVAPYTGRYNGYVIIDQNSSGALGGEPGVMNKDWVWVGMKIKDSSGNVLQEEGTGGPGAWYWTDFVLCLSVSLVKGQTYTLNFQYQYAWPTTSGTLLSLTYNWNLATVS